MLIGAGHLKTSLTNHSSMRFNSTQFSFNRIVFFPSFVLVTADGIYHPFEINVKDVLDVRYFIFMIAINVIDGTLSGWKHNGVDIDLTDHIAS